MNTLLRRSLAALTVLTVPFAAFSITIRHDVADINYRNLGNSYTGVGDVFATNNGVFGSGGSGTMISANWMVTAAHVVDGYNSVIFTVGGNSYASNGIFFRAGWTLTNGLDIALVRFGGAGITNVDHYGINQNVDPIGKVGTTVGFGFTGNGNTGATGAAGTKRGGRNMIDMYNDGTQRVLLNDFDNGAAGNNSMGSATPLDLEHGVAGGDSGGGLFIDHNGQALLTGVTSFVAAFDGNPNSDYGDLGGYTSVAYNYDWIVETSGVPEPGTMALAGLGALALIRKRRASKKA